MKNVHINISFNNRYNFAIEKIKASNLNCSAKKKKKSGQYDLASYKNIHLLKLASEKKS